MRPSSAYTTFLSERGGIVELETYWYECSPFLYTALGGFILGRADSILLLVSSALLLSAGGTIFILRRRHALNEIRRLRFGTIDDSDDDIDVLPSK